MSFKAHTHSYTMQAVLIYCSKDYKLRLDRLSKKKKCWAWKFVKESDFILTKNNYILTNINMTVNFVRYRIYVVVVCSGLMSLSKKKKKKSLIWRRCLAETGSSMLTFIVMSHRSIMPQTLVPRRGTLPTELPGPVCAGYKRHHNTIYCLERTSVVQLIRKCLIIQRISVDESLWQKQCKYVLW